MLAVPSPGIYHDNCRISVGRFQFSIIPTEDLILPVFKGSALRGGFGYAFRRIICALKKTECADCMLSEKCIYSYVFETPPPAETQIMRKYTAAPHPFIIEPPAERRMGYKAGDEIAFGLILIGKAVDYLPYFVYTFDELGGIGIGKGKGKFELRTVISKGECLYDRETKKLKVFQPEYLELTLPSQDFPSSQDALQLTMTFHTPTRIAFEKHLTLDLEFHIFIRSLLRRLSLLWYFHCQGDPSAWDFKSIIERARGIKVKKRDLRWYDWERYSNRQGTRMKMGGFIGEVTFEGDIEPFMPLLRAGEILHAGKGTSFGLGKYEIR